MRTMLKVRVIKARDVSKDPLPGGHGNLISLLGGEPKARVEDVPLDEIITTQKYVDEKKVQRIAESWPGDGNPPLLLELSGQKFILDGHHRYAAAALVGEPAMTCKIIYAAPVGTDSKGKPVVQKADPALPEQRLVWGEVYAPNRPDVHGEYMDAQAIKEMAHDFMHRKMQIGMDVQHDNKSRPKLRVVESFIAREGDPDFIPGSWVICVFVEDDEIWQKIKNGELNGFSVEALVVKEEKEVEIEVPDRVTGTTTEVDGHGHTFSVQYDRSGKLIGGTTSMTNGHTHAIRGGTITEESQGHRHRFSAVDNLAIIER